MEILNLSAEPVWKLHQWLPHDLSAEKVVFLPDACPGKSPLPTGTAVLTRQEDWRRFAVSDCGCGMRLLSSEMPACELTSAQWNAIAHRLAGNKGKLGDLGGGNHFLDALEPCEDSRLHLLIHTGSRMESGLVDRYTDHPDSFDREFGRVVEWAESNRAAVQAEAEAVLGPLKMLLDLPHNTFEPLEGGGVVIRKGAVRVEPGDLNIIPSSMAGDAVLVRATEKVNLSLNALSHGTGRKMSRGECKPLAESYDFDALRRAVMLPDRVLDASLRTEGPYAYRELDSCLALLDGYVEELERFAVVAYMGHL